MTLFQLNCVSIPASFCLIKPTDGLLLKRDSCWMLFQQTSWPTSNLFVLEHDVKTLQIEVPAHFVTISDCEWVDLTLKYQQVVNCQ